jgi:hypothetical protein
MYKRHNLHIKKMYLNFKKILKQELQDKIKI